MHLNCNLLGQFLILHVLPSNCFPVHGFPPNCGGFLNLFLLCLPSPQETEQASQSSHSNHSQSTTFIHFKKIKLVFLFVLEYILGQCPVEQ